MEQRYTVILVPEGQSAVRRYTVLGSSVKRGAIAAGVAAFLALILAGDWVRLRIQAVDVAKLRAETQAQREEIVTLSEDVTRAQNELSRLGEFERKVRIIADLPATLAQTDTVNLRNGQGGSENAIRSDGGEPPPADATEEAETEVGSRPKADPVSQVEPIDFIGVDPHERLPTLRERAADLLSLALTRRASFTDLLDGLEDKQVQLAATPSLWPTEGWVTSGYGWRIHPLKGRRHFHSGIDIAASFGTPVIAPATGKVEFSGRKRYLGNTVIIRHSRGVRTWYGHMQDLHVARGDRVIRGQQIGSVGSTGQSTGPHLHYVVELNGKTVNPINYVID